MGSALYQLNAGVSSIDDESQQNFLYKKILQKKNGGKRNCVQRVPTLTCMVLQATVTIAPKQHILRIFSSMRSIVGLYPTDATAWVSNHSINNSTSRQD